jgi:subtilase family serine protease
VGVPQWAGIVADANQAVGHPLGFLNPLIYRLGARGVLSTVLHDITVGNNSGIAGIPGYNATHGWDATTGWGTPKELNALLGG